MIVFGINIIFFSMKYALKILTTKMRVFLQYYEGVTVRMSNANVVLVLLVCDVININNTPLCYI